MSDDSQSSKEDASAQPASGQIACTMASTLLKRVRAALGEGAIDELLRLADVPYTAAYLEDVGNWIWYPEAIALFEAAETLTGDEEIGRKVGAETVRQHAGTAVATLLRSLGSPQAVYEQLTAAVTKFSTVSELIPVEVAPGRAVIRKNGRDGAARHRHMCNWTAGLLSAAPELWGLPSATVEESLCELRGDSHCLYNVTWDAEHAARAADPQELVTALEVQLAAMKERLESVYATARDLISTEDLDVALARITERAATAVRAPKYLLAVRTSPGADLLVHHRGFVDEDPTSAARALLEETTEQHDESRLVARVASGSRDYGRLMAAAPAGTFFPQERELLDVYARYAAAVLDTATALDDARRRHRQTHALLSLSQALASAGTGEEVAQRLVEAAPAVVDCDRMAVLLWSEQEQALTCRAFTELAGDAADLLGELRIRPSDTHHIAALVDAPEPSPLFFDPDTPDQFMARLMTKAGSQALVLVPIVTKGRFYGVLGVSVIERPERLQRTPELLDRLAGVVAQAATALDNARLIETMLHQARHDNLTGLLGHRAFHEALGLELGNDQADRVFALATVDIDDFKLVNDLYGHPTGDKALRRVAAALRESIREEDVVFRVGGEEFTVILPGLTARDALPVAERLRAAVAAISFVMPLRVSIGLASYPADAADRKALLERADAAMYAAKRGGKDRTSMADAKPRVVSDSSNALMLLERLRGKDSKTVAHSARVAALAVDLGEQLDLDGDRLAHLRIAGLLHDVGKIGVPDAILAKPGPLDEDELRIVQTHPLVGAEIVRAWGFPQAARLVLEHHEHVDGGGYPAGLAGDAICLEARILHVVDAFAAMTTDRPYRGAMSHEYAMSELRSLSGTQFDADAVGALEHLMRARSAVAASDASDGNGLVGRRS
ncbi:MAG: hypothetical protein QOK04_1368 [Solirubrobacteraceae bacterium]|nr:hypothetical protein [Solirubrobacteraceae bacterium]